jgi:hypothetical protein
MKGRIITSPEPIEHPFQKSIFLAGGISDCADWQKGVAERIASETNAVVYNPRRTDFDMDAGADLSRIQIRWEYHALRVCQFNLFWFPEETLCPITLMGIWQRNGAHSCWWSDVWHPPQLCSTL